MNTSYARHSQQEKKKEHEVMNAHKGSSAHKFWDYVENLVFISRQMHLEQEFETLITNTLKEQSLKTFCLATIISGATSISFILCTNVK